MVQSPSWEAEEKEKGWWYNNNNNNNLLSYYLLISWCRVLEKQKRRRRDDYDDDDDIIIIITYLLTPWCRVLLEKLTGLQLVKKFPAFHGTRRFITALTSVRQLSVSWASPIQSIYPHPTSWRSILILSTHLRLGLPSGSFPPFSPARPCAMMWKNIVERGRPQITIWRMLAACWRILKATNTHSEYVILFVFHRNKGYTNACQCYVIRTLSCCT